MASRKTHEMKQRLLEERDRLLRQREALDNQIAGIERAISLVGDEVCVSPAQKRRTSTKSVVLDLLEDVGTTGLNASIAVDLADRRGISIERASTSSLLSRLKSDGIVVFDGDKYRLKKYAPNAGPQNSLDRLNVVGMETRKN